MRRLLALALGALSVLAWMLVPTSLWTEHVVLDNAEYAAVSSEAFKDPQVRQELGEAVSSKVTDAARIYATQRLRVPPGLADLAVSTFSGPMRAAVRAGIDSPAGAKVWAQSQADVHGQIVALIQNNDSDIELRDGTVSINVEDLVRNTAQNLQAQGVNIPIGDLRIAPIEVAVPPLVSRGYPFLHFLVTYEWVIIAVAVCSLVGALALATAKARRLAILAGGVALLALALAVLAPWIVDSSPTVAATQLPALTQYYTDWLASTWRIYWGAAAGISAVVCALALAVGRASTHDTRTSARIDEYA